MTTLLRSPLTRKTYLKATFLAALWINAATLLATTERPNVLFILTDNQSYEELSCRGHTEVQTPNIDRFAADAIDFTNFHAPPFCSPSRAAILTGRYSMRAGIHNTIGGVSILHKDEVTIADRLKKAGYKTAVFGKWHLGLSHPYHPKQRGFDKAFIHGGGGIGQLEDYYGNAHLHPVFEDDGVFVHSEGFSTDVLFAEATQFIREQNGDPFFCFISTPATHRPWQAHPQAAERIKARGKTYPPNELALYSMIENIDDNVGSILRFLADSNLEDNTLVILATDQGTRRERQHKDLAYDEYHQVFCFARYPPLTRGQERASNLLTGVVDLTPTIMDLCGLPPDPSLDGRSLRACLQGEDRWHDDRTLIVQCPRGRVRQAWVNVSVKTQDYRLLNGNQLFHSQSDPSQTRNIAASHREVVQRLRQRYQSFWNSLPASWECLSRHELGAYEAPSTKLNAMDWYRDAAPWHQLHMPDFKGNGVWAVDVIRAGEYRFELRHYPREAPQALEAEKAVLRMGDHQARIELSPDDDCAVFTLRLSPGDYDLRTAFSPTPSNPRGDEWGALFVYVDYLGP